MYHVLLVRKFDNGFKGEVIAWNGEVCGSPLEMLFNRHFKPYKKGEVMKVTINVSAKGRRVVKYIERHVEEEEEKVWVGLSGVVMGKSKAEFEGEMVFHPKVKVVTSVQEPVKKEEVNQVGNYYVSPEARLVFNTVHGMAQARPERAVKVMMKGASGYGKTTLPQKFAEMTGRKFLRMNCASVRDPEEWFGYREAREGSTVFIKSQFAKAIEAGNLVVVLDEFNRLEPWLHNTLFPLLDDAGATVVHDEEFHIGQDVIVVGTINTGFKYTGTFELDEALLNRFQFVLEVGPMPHAEEVKVLCANTGIDDHMASLIVKMSNILRQNEIVCSTRTSLLVASMFRGGMELREAFEFAVVYRIPTDSAGSGLRKQVVDLVNVQLGPMEQRTLTSDLFRVGEPEPVVQEQAVVYSDHEHFSYPTLTLSKEPGRELLFLALIKQIRALPLLSADGMSEYTVSLSEGQKLADKVRQGETVVITLARIPAFMRDIGDELKRCGVVCTIHPGAKS